MAMAFGLQQYHVHHQASKQRTRTSSHDTVPFICQIPKHNTQTYIHTSCHPLCRFSVLWAPTCGALAAALASHRSTAWPPISEQLTKTQALLLSGYGDTRAAAASATAAAAAAAADAAGKSGDAFVLEGLEDRWKRLKREAAAAAGEGSTDAGNRLGHLLKALAQAPSGALEALSSQWVPLFLEYAYARGVVEEVEEGDVAIKGPQQGAGFADVAGLGGAAGAEMPVKRQRVDQQLLDDEQGQQQQQQQQEQQQSQSQSQGQQEQQQGQQQLEERRASHGSSGPGPASVGAKRRRGKQSTDAGTPSNEAAAAPAAAAAISDAGADVQTAAPDVVTADGQQQLDVDGDGDEEEMGVEEKGQGRQQQLRRVGAKVWRAQMLEWLKVVAAVKGARGMQR